MSSNNFVQNYGRYVIERQRIRARQRVELEAELHDFAVAVGGDINDLRTNGKPMADIAAMVGLKNRSVLYELWRVFKEKGVPVYTTQPAVSKEPVPVPVSTEYTLTLHLNDSDEAVGGNVVTTIGGTGYIVYYADGEITETPDEWAEGSRAERMLYKQILDEIRSLIK